ncbi:MAG: 4-hydroxy-3-methylbut-2-enyl diphosphate reductase [Nitrospinae bacterium]|nr:4-hydroxy-3-methylbut-2-enyl diphosphate reductase [Nitrospinota bacterium]
MAEDNGIKVASTAGFCWGVKNAMDLALKTAREADGPVYTHGPLIHNPQVIEMLEGKDIFALTDAAQLEAGRVIIRTHGVTPQTRRSLKDRGLNVTDATCPLVARVQGIIKKHASKGYSTIIIGDKGHAEVLGLEGYAQGRGYVISSVEEARALPAMEKVCVVAQTTCDILKYHKIVEVIKERWPDAAVQETICGATEDRQEEVRRLSREVDAMVVVGGKSSANTTRLAGIAREVCPVVFLIETEDELDPVEMLRFKRIGVTAGASTPTWMIERVRDRIADIRGKGKRGGLTGFARSAFETFMLSNLYLCAGGALLAYANATLGGYGLTTGSVAISGLYLFSMYVLNQLNDLQTFKHNEPEKTWFYHRWKRVMVGSAAVAGVLGFALAFRLGLAVGLIYVFAMFMGLAYTVKWFPKTNLLRIHRLKDIPASKDVFTGAGWVAATVAMPAAAWDGDVNMAAGSIALIFTFTLVYIRSVLSDIRDIRGDRLVGRETIPIMIGVEGSKVFLALVTIGMASLLVSSAASGLVGPFAYVLTLSIGYTGMYLWFYHKKAINRGFKFDLVVDGVFHFTGALALAWTFLT